MINLGIYPQYCIVTGKNLSIHMALVFGITKRTCRYDSGLVSPNDRLAGARQLTKL